MSYENLQMFNTKLLFTFGLLTIMVTKCGFKEFYPRDFVVLSVKVVLKIFCI